MFPRNCDVSGSIPGTQASKQSPKDYSLKIGCHRYYDSKKNVQKDQKH